MLDFLVNYNILPPVHPATKAVIASYTIPSCRYSGQSIARGETVVCACGAQLPVDRGLGIPPHESQAMIEYLRLLYQLHLAIAAGKGDEPEADAIREKMEAPERKMSETERSFADMISATLYIMLDTAE